MKDKLLTILVSPFFFLWLFSQRLIGLLRRPLSIAEMNKRNHYGGYYTVQDEGEIFEVGHISLAEGEAPRKVWTFQSRKGDAILLTSNEYKMRNGKVVVRGFWHCNLQLAYLMVC